MFRLLYKAICTLQFKMFYDTQLAMSLDYEKHKTVDITMTYKHVQYSYKITQLNRTT